MRLDGTVPGLLDDVRERARWLTGAEPPRTHPYDVAAVRSLGRAAVRTIAVIAVVEVLLLAVVLWRRGAVVLVLGGLALVIGAVWLVVMIRLRAATMGQVDLRSPRPGVRVGPSGVRAHGVGEVPWSALVGVFVTDVTAQELARTARTRGAAALGRRLTRAGSNGWVGVHLFFRETPVRRAAQVTSLPRWTPGGKERKEPPVEHWGSTVLQIDRIMAPADQLALARDLEAAAERHGIAWAELPDYGPVADWLQSQGLEALNPRRMGAWIADDYLPAEPTVPYPAGVTAPAWAQVIAERRARAGRPPLDPSR